MRLHHLTTEAGLQAILADGIIRCIWPAEVSDEFPQRVVLLTTETDPNKRGWKVGSGSFLIVSRITVDVQDKEVRSWSDWKIGHDPAPVSGLETSARAWGGDPKAWYVVERDIPRSEWVDISHP